MQNKVTSDKGTVAGSGGSSGGAPEKASLILASLIIVAAVANLPLAMANVALPSIGAAFQASQTQLNLVAVGYSLGLACSVLWLGALGDRYGRKLMLLLGVGLAIPAALLAGFAPTIQILIIARLVGGVAAHGLPDDLIVNRRPLGAWCGANAGHCLVGRPWRGHFRGRPPDFWPIVDPLRLELGLPYPSAPGVCRLHHGLAICAGPY